MGTRRVAMDGVPFMGRDITWPATLRRSSPDAPSRDLSHGRPCLVRFLIVWCASVHVCV
jgi:hypothetical protein